MSQYWWRVYIALNGTLAIAQGKYVILALRKAKMALPYLIKIGSQNQPHLCYAGHKDSKGQV